MILAIEEVLSGEEVARTRETLAAMRFVDGSATAGWHARLVKRVLQVDRADPGYSALNQRTSEAILKSGLFRSAARPRALSGLLFSRYAPGMGYGPHVDDALMGALRSDVSFTLFLAQPEEYAGGELVIESGGGERAFKLPAGQLLLYPSTSLHRVNPVERGERFAAVGWCQSFVRDAAQREILHELEGASRRLFQQSGKTREFDQITRSLSNLLRMWADA